MDEYARGFVRKKKTSHPPGEFSRREAHFHEKGTAKVLASEGKEKAGPNASKGECSRNEHVPRGLVAGDGDLQYLKRGPSEGRGACFAERPLHWKEKRAPLEKKNGKEATLEVPS